MPRRNGSWRPGGALLSADEEPAAPQVSEDGGGGIPSLKDLLGGD
ncbi:MAG: hypothetical protein U0992_01730 [Planctomycetaceae bacterium]